MAVFDNNRMTRYSIAGLVIFFVLGVVGWYFIATRISTPERQGSQAPVSTQR